MPNQEFMEIIKKTESIAEEIIFNANIDQKDKIARATDQTKEVLINARLESSIKYKEVVKQQKEQGDEFLLQSIKAAKEQACEIYRSTEKNIDDTVKEVMKGIVGYCANN